MPVIRKPGFTGERNPRTIMANAIRSKFSGVQCYIFFRERFWEAGVAPDAEGGVAFGLVPGGGSGWLGGAGRSALSGGRQPEFWASKMISRNSTWPGSNS